MRFEAIVVLARKRIVIRAFSIEAFPIVCDGLLAAPVASVG